MRLFIQFWQRRSIRNNLLILSGITVLVIIGVMQIPDEDNGPCSPRGFIGECYSINRAVCEATLALSETSCKSKMKSAVKPGQLGGPILANCEEVNIDHVLHYTRRSTPKCSDRIKDLELWRKSNPDL